VNRKLVAALTVRRAQALRMELIASPIRVTAISPGLVETEFSVVRFAGDEARAASIYKGLTPLNADDVAETVVFAASRPEHVQVAGACAFVVFFLYFFSFYLEPTKKAGPAADITLFPSAQASVYHIHRA
jgi:short-subunit dehydrogenase